MNARKHATGRLVAANLTRRLWHINRNHAKWFPNGFPAGPSGPFQLIVASWRGANANPPEGPYGLSALDLTPEITF